MKQIVFLIILCTGLSVHGYGQNLIKNPSFEIEPNRERSDSSSWMLIDACGTPDFIDFSRKPSIDSRIPGPILKHYQPRSGNCAIALCPISAAYPFEMEHILAKLDTSLVKDSVYYCEFYVRAVSIDAEFFTNNMGVMISRDQLLSEYNFGRCYSYPIDPLVGYPLESDIEQGPTFICSDTSWTKVCGLFTASGGETYLTIGAFWNSEIDMVYERYQSKGTGNTIRRLKNAIKKRMLTKNKNNRLKETWLDDDDLSYYLIDDVWLSLASSSKIGVH